MKTVNCQFSISNSQFAICNLFVCALLLSPAAAAEPEIIVELSAKEGYQGQSVLYRITLNNVENASAPELAGFDDFDVALEALEGEAFEDR